MIAWALLNWRVLVLGLLVLGIGIQTWRLGHAQNETLKVQAQFSAFRATTEALGRVAEAQKKQQEAADKQRKERADAENKTERDRLAADVKRLRLERDRATGSFVSAATSCPASAEGAEKYRAEFERAYRVLVAGLRAVGDTGTKAVTDLNTAKDWAQ